MRAWGSAGFDTASRELPVVDISIKGNAMAILRGGRRSFLHGIVGARLPVPVLPVGTTYVDVEFRAGWAWGPVRRSDDVLVMLGSNPHVPSMPALPPGLRP